MAKRNIALVIADDLGRDLSCFGNRRTGTPELDALAAQSSRITIPFAACARRPIPT